MKLEEERKKLIIEIVKLIGGICVFVALYIGASAWQSGAVQVKTDALSKSSQLQAEISGLRSKIDSSGASQKIYANLVEERGNSNFVIENEKVRDVLQELVKRHRITVSDKLEYSAERDFKDPALSTVAMPITVRQEAKLKFAAISDVHAYAFLQSLSHELPGTIKYRQFKLSRKFDLDDELITQLALGRTINTVEVEVAFDWFGFKNKVESDAPADGANP